MEQVRITARSAGEQAALAMIATLRAAVPEGGQAHQVRVLPTAANVSAGDAANNLILAQKPVCCSARVEGDTLLISLRSPQDEKPTLPLGMAFPDWLDGTLGRESTDRQVLLIALDQVLLIRAEALTVLKRDYCIEMPHSIAGREPNARQRADGIAWILEVSPGGSIALDPDDLDLPEPFRALVSNEWRRIDRSSEELES